MNIRMLSLALATVFSTGCAVQDHPTPHSQLGVDPQEVESPRCGPVCEPAPELSFLAAAYGPDCATAYANALTNAQPVTVANCRSEGYLRACGVTSTPQYCDWVPDVGQYEGYTEISEGCIDSSC